MAFAYVGSTFTPSVFGALAGIGGYAWMPFFALILAVLMIALFTAQKRIVQARRKDPRTKAWFA